MLRPLRLLGLLAIAAAASAWLGGLGWFVASSLTMPADPATPTDAIVVLTGGRQRLETGLALLAAGKAKRLFISGVNPRVDRDALLRALGPAAQRAACRIVLGHAADDTYGNARETAVWMGEEGYTSLRLVTSWYHMPRSLLEFRRAMPQATIIPHPVFAAHGDPEGWWGRHGGGVMLVIGEYDKYLAAWLRPMIIKILPPPPPPAPSSPIIRTVASRRGGGGGDATGRVRQ
jgi:uncharacterized SAM-binding protein YcdF (DUF218 family)